jgi:hypothetical protein
MVRIKKTRWHRLLGSLLEQLLTPVGISVLCDVKIMNDPPEVDILLLRRQTKAWTEAQKQRLADGIRDSSASHILLEFKYSESFSEKALQQTLGYDFFYKSRHHLKDESVQSFLVCAKTPRSKILEKFTYQVTEHKGVYKSEIPVLRQVILIVLNELRDEPHNAWIKCFASRPKERMKAFLLLKIKRLNSISLGVEYFLSGLWKLWSGKIGEREMNIEMTPEEVMEMGEFWGDSFLSLLEVDDILPYFDSSQIVAKLSTEERLAGLNKKDFLAKLNTEERLSGLNTEDLLARLSIEEIERYLQKRK